MFIYLCILKTSVGHQYLWEEFNVTTPPVAYHIDPFGHSALTPILFSSVGHHAAIINRIPLHQKKAFGRQKRKEFLWFGQTDNNDKENGLFTHVLHDHYSSLLGAEGTDWEREATSINDRNIERRAEIFVEHLRERASQYSTDNILFLWGDDFRFVQPSKCFENMDRLMTFINERQNLYGFHLQYSTISAYFRAVEAETPFDSFPSYTGDFFPYVDRQPTLLNYWSGFYSTRPLLKAIIRMAEARVRAMDAMLSLSLVSSSSLASSFAELMERAEEARRLVALLQHHDAITGTCTVRAYRDYKKKAFSAIDIAQSLMTKALQALTSERKKKSNWNLLTSFSHEQTNNDNEDYASLHELRLVIDDESFASHRLNTNENENAILELPLLFFNSLGWNRTEWTDILLDIRTTNYFQCCERIVVLDDVGNIHSSVQSVLLSPSPSSSQLQRITFLVSDVPPIGFRTFFLRLYSSSSPSSSSSRSSSSSFAFSLTSEERVTVTPQFKVYRSPPINNLGSGAYLFRTYFWPYFWLGWIVSCGGLSLLFFFFFRWYLRHRHRLGRRHQKQKEEATHSLPILQQQTQTRIKNYNIKRVSFVAIHFVVGIAFGVLLFYLLSRDYFHLHDSTLLASSFEGEATELEKQQQHFVSSEQLFGLEIGAMMALVVLVVRGWKFGCYVLVTVLPAFVVVYVFWPSLLAVPLSSSASYQTITGELYTETTQSFSDTKAQLRVRRYLNDASQLELYPIAHANPGEELVLRFSFSSSSRFDTLRTFNGMFHVRRPSFLHFRGIPGNYYPLLSEVEVVSSSAFGDEGRIGRIALMSRQSLGVALLERDELEVMLHRHPLHDDQKGLKEPVLDDSTVGIPLLLSLSNHPHSQLRQQQKRIRFNHPLQVFLFSGAKAEMHSSSSTLSLLHTSLPDSAYLLSIKPQPHQQQLLLRFTRTQHEETEEREKEENSFSLKDIFDGETKAKRCSSSSSPLSCAELLPNERIYLPPLQVASFIVDITPSV
ncbi:Alpha-mannosidase 2, variant 2 [Balamuthia mandrillaris]